MADKKLCGDCLHYEACQSWNVGSLLDTNAEHCANWRESVDEPTYKDPNAVPVVRCRDCKHRVKNSCDSVEFYECDHMGLGQTRVGVKDDFFCADGKRKGGNE